jgi:hypothetical protein
LVVVADPDAVWTRAAMGVDELYQFMIVGPDGAMVDCGQAGAFWIHDNKNTYFPAQSLMNFLKNAATDTVLPKDKKYPDVLAPIVRAAELRQYAQAIALCAAAAKSPAKADAATLKEDFLKALEERVKSLSETAGDANAESAKRMEALMELKKINRDLASTVPGKAAAKAVAASNKDKVLQGEIQAYQEYMTIHQQAAGAGNFTRNPQFEAALKAVSEKHPNTKFGRMAADEARRLSEVAKVATKSASAPAIPRS